MISAPAWSGVPGLDQRGFGRTVIANLLANLVFPSTCESTGARRKRDQRAAEHAAIAAAKGNVTKNVEGPSSHGKRNDRYMKASSIS